MSRLFPDKRPHEPIAPETMLTHAPDDPPEITSQFRDKILAFGIVFVPFCILITIGYNYVILPYTPSGRSLYLFAAIVAFLLSINGLAKYLYRRRISQGNA